MDRAGERDPRPAAGLRVQRSFACTCYHPLFVFNQFGDLERRALRSGDVRRANGRDRLLKPVVTRCQGKVSRIYFRRTRPLKSTSSWRRSDQYANPVACHTSLASRIGYLLSVPSGDRNEVASLPCQFQLVERESWTSRAG